MARHPETGGANRSESERTSSPVVPLVRRAGEPRAGAHNARSRRPGVRPAERAMPRLLGIRRFMLFEGDIPARPEQICCFGYGRPFPVLCWPGSGRAVGRLGVVECGPGRPRSRAIAKRCARRRGRRRRASARHPHRPGRGAGEPHHGHRDACEGQDEDTDLPAGAPGPGTARPPPPQVARPQPPRHREPDRVDQDPAPRRLRPGRGRGAERIVSRWRGISVLQAHTPPPPAALRRGHHLGQHNTRNGRPYPKQQICSDLAGMSPSNSMNCRMPSSAAWPAHQA